ncbi:hypothetical protein AB0H57_14355 [Micromonospora sp. NPDC050686]|uniref:hypothetical protein n=1 Tax=Micromonospora sp. NPDC050686 TaxID=3154631 RepID=UPI0033D5278B
MTLRRRTSRRARSVRAAAVPAARKPVPKKKTAVPATHWVLARRPAVPDGRKPVSARTGAVRDRTTAVPATGGQDPTVRDRRGTGRPVRDRGPDISALVPTGRAAARTLAEQGLPLSRKALAHHLRADGHQLSNATASALLRLLRAEATPAALTHQEAA